MIETFFDRIRADSESFEPWRSPLRALVLSPANRVKWLTKKEQHRLLNYLGGPAEEDEEAEGEEAEQSGTWKGGLAGEERFDLAFWLTLLRADIFGAIQASIVARLRKRATGEVAIAQAMEQVEGTAYVTAAAAYAELRQQLHLEILAALATLMEAEVPQAIILMDLLGGARVVKTIIGSTPGNRNFESGEEIVAAEELSTTIGPALSTAIGNPNALPDDVARRLLHEALAARKKVTRIGFRQDDWTNTDMVAALVSGVAAVFEVIRELDRITAVLSQKAPAGDVANDSVRFRATFHRIYAAPDS